MSWSNIPAATRDTMIVTPEKKEAPITMALVLMVENETAMVGKVLLVLQF